MNPKFPHISIRLVGEDGNAFSIMGRCTRAMREGGCTAEDIAAYRTAATSGDYDNLLRVTMQTVDCDALDGDMDEEDGDDE